jgi:hypothetical protein
MAIVFKPLSDTLDDAVHAHQLEPGAGMDRALQAFGTVHGLLALRKQEGRFLQLEDLDGLIERALGALLRGWGADPARIPHHFAALHALHPLAEDLGVST